VHRAAAPFAITSLLAHDLGHHLSRIGALGQVVPMAAVSAGH
jgi:hypothetical protein